MVAAQTANIVRPQPGDSPFFDGYREIRTTDETGKTCVTQRPLNRLELLHLKKNDYEMASSYHGEFVVYLYSVVR